MSDQWDTSGLQNAALLAGLVPGVNAMNTLTLRQAAALLKIHPVTLQNKARAGEIPGTKIGKCWVFIEVDLIELIRSQYKRRVSEGEHEELATCHFTDARIRPSGGSKSPSVDEQYQKALGLPIR
jgi:excisionase family DNA binding protein